MLYSPEAGPPHLSGLDFALHWEEGVVPERFDHPTQETPHLPDGCKEGSLGLPP